jgi:opacity protein-like surface antigen
MGLPLSNLEGTPMKLAIAVVAVLAQAVPLAHAAAQEPTRPADAAAPAQPPAWIPAAKPARSSTPVYVTLRGGMYQPRGDFMDVIEFNSGLELEAAFGVQVHRNVALEGGIGYYGASTDTVTVTDGIDTISMKMKLGVIPITASLRLMAPAGAVTFSALAGVGVHMAELEADLDWPGVISGSTSESDNVFGLHLGGGVAVQVSERASVGAELRYTFAEATFLEEDVELDGLRIGAVLSFRL